MFAPQWLQNVSIWFKQLVLYDTKTFIIIRGWNLICCNQMERNIYNEVLRIRLSTILNPMGDIQVYYTLSSVVAASIAPFRWGWLRGIWPHYHVISAGSGPKTSTSGVRRSTVWDSWRLKLISHEHSEVWICMHQEPKIFCDHFHWQRWNKPLRGRDSSVGRARDSWWGSPGFDSRCGRPLLSGWVSIIWQKSWSSRSVSCVAARKIVRRQS